MIIFAVMFVDSEVGVVASISSAYLLLIGQMSQPPQYLPFEQQ